jgi:transcriptional regulator with XRE-family HTH domain
VFVNNFGFTFVIFINIYDILIVKVSVMHEGEKLMNIGEKIKYFRTLHKISGEKLSELSGISISTIRKYETGERKPKSDQLLKISEALGISINTFMDFDIKTVSDLLSLIFKMDEQLDLHLEAKQDNQGVYDPNSLKLSFGNETVNQKLLTYMLAVQKREEYIANHTPADTDQYAETLADIENNIVDLQNRLLDDNTIIQKDIVSPVNNGSNDIENASGTSQEVQSRIQDVLYDCSPSELELILQTAQTIKDCLRNQNKQ